jgi:serine protease Do
MMRGWNLILACCLAAILTGGCTDANVQKSGPQAGTPVKAADTAAHPLSLAPAIEKAMPSVVFIYTEKNKLVGGKPAFEGGSGVILAPDGYLLTNRHVVDDAKNVWVTLYDRSTYEATTVSVDLLMDLAVVKINASGLPAASAGDPDKLKVGDYVIALGNPLGMSPADGIGTATSGIVSKLDCSFTMQGVPYYDMIQTDAAINTGNSGGPLINLDGEVVGINSAHALFAQNVGFAIGMNTAKHLFDDLAEMGKVDHPYIGIIAEDMRPQLTATAMNAQKRVIITNVEEGTPSAAAGLKVKDIILRVNGQEINSVTQLTRTVWRMDAGDTIKITCLRGGETVELTVTLATRPDDEPLAEL